MSTISFELQNLYSRQFGSKPKIGTAEAMPAPEPFVINGSKQQLTSAGSALTADYLGREIWLPVKFFELDANVFGVSELLMPYAVIKISNKKNIISTPMVERQGSVKEFYSIEDYNITLKGFLVGYDKTGVYPQWPEADLNTLKKLWELNEAVKLDNALSNIFIGNDHRVVIASLDLPEVEEGKKNYRPFSMTLESDTIFELELE